MDNNYQLHRVKQHWYICLQTFISGQVNRVFLAIQPKQGGIILPDKKVNALDFAVGCDDTVPTKSIGGITTYTIT